VGAPSDDRDAGGLPVALRGQDIVCIGFADWDSGVWTNQQHLMSRLAAGNRVLFVESLGLRKPRVGGRDLRRMLRRLGDGLRGVRTVDGVLVLSPLVVPLHGSPWIRSLNERLLSVQVGRAARRAGMRKPILWAYVPQAEALIPTLEPSLVIYHCVDDIAMQKGVDGESFAGAERRFVDRADLVIASAPGLAKRMRGAGANVLEAPNVADTSLFAQALDPGPIDPEMAALPEPRVVFVGAITATKLDLELLRELALIRPDWSIALIGPVGTGDPDTDVSGLEAIPNLHLLGSRPHRELPSALRGATVGLIPYAINPLTESIFPMKVYEYLAAGLGVVSTPLPSLSGVEGLEIAADAPGVAVRIERLLEADSAEERAARSKLAAGHSWEARLEEISEALERLQP
jgi:glycosyltransferase involved in cell wall biosynthesis